MGPYQRRWLEAFLVSTGLEIAEVHAASPWMPDVGALFACYRRHYGQPGDVVEVRDWLNSQLASGGLRGFLARRDGEPGGMALVASTPASLRLGHFWQLRDLYVADRHRRQGVGRALLTRVRDAAAAEGALRVSLTTEADNIGASTLYRQFGSEPPQMGHTQSHPDHQASRTTISERGSMSITSPAESRSPTG
jgi:GNAT superfamily N-acetyltransferase